MAENSPSPEILPPQISLWLLNREDMFYELDENLRTAQERLNLHDLFSSSLNATYRKRRSSRETLQEMLSSVSFEFRKAPRLKAKHVPYIKELKQLECSYRNAMEKFQYQLQKFVCSVQELRQVLKKTVVEFHNASRLTAQVTLVASVTEISFILVHFLHKMFDFSWNPHISKLSTLVGGVSVTASLVVLSYMKQSTTAISKHVRNDNWIFSDLTYLLRKGSWVDEEVLKLFPHGINAKLITDEDLQERSIFKDKIAWKQFMCSVVLLTNVQKSDKLLVDEEFLERVKLFVESKTAEIWWHRIKLRKLLDDLSKKIHEVSTREFVADHEIHYKRTALYLYAILIPWLLNSWNSIGLKVSCSVFAAVLAFSDLEGNESPEFEELKKLSQKFEKDIVEINYIYEALESDYD